MTRARILLMAMVLSACAEPSSGPVKVAGTTSTTLPPSITIDCVDLILLDDKCTADWYRCRSPSDDDRSCVRAWKACCELPGQGSRKKIGAVETLPRD